ncbi:MAG: sugar ABC transporter substrate-binding protein [Armatimonadota bacterium]
MHFKRIVLLLVIIAVIFSICGCLKKQEDSRTKIEFWTISLRPTFDDFIHSLINKYEKENPNIKLIWVDIPYNVLQQKLMSSIAGGVSPDVVNLNTPMAIILAQHEALVDLNKYLTKEEQERYFKNLYNATNIDGSVYALPWYVTTKITMYNSDIFKKAGLKRPPKNYDEVAQYAKIIKEKTGIYGYMPDMKVMDDFQCDGIPIVNKDMTKALFNCPQGVERLTWYVDLYKQDLIPRETINLGTAYQTATNRYQCGELGMLITGANFLLRIKNNAAQVYDLTKVAPMPLGKAHIYPAAVMNFVIPRASKNRKEAVKFALFMTNDENQLAFCKVVPLLPSTRKAALDEFFIKGKGMPTEDEAIRISIKELFNSKDLSLALPERAKLGEYLTDAVQSALVGKKTPKQALDDAAAQWDKILKIQANLRNKK